MPCRIAFLLSLVRWALLQTSLLLVRSARLRFVHSLLCILASIYSQNEQGLERLLPTDAFENYVKSQPLGRLGSVRDIADATVYLFADTGSYVSGQVLVGGLSWSWNYLLLSR